jgi:hypothetical protein
MYVDFRWWLWFPVVVVVDSVVRTVVIIVVHCCQIECFGNGLLSSSQSLKIKCLRLRRVGSQFFVVSVSRENKKFSWSFQVNSR